MATNKLNAPNIDSSDLINFPDGRIKDNDGTGDGTGVNRLIYSDLHEFFAYLMRAAALQYNGLPESVGNGYQLIQALMNFAVKNDYIAALNATTVIIGGVNTNVLSVGLKLSTLNVNESVVCLAAADFNNAITLIAGSESGVYQTITVPSNYKAGDYLQLIVTNSGITLIRLANALNLQEICTELGFLQAATGAEELAGTIDTVGTTPYTNQLAFTNRLNGSESGTYLATPTNNGLMSAADKTTLNSLNNPVKNVGWFSGVDVNGGNPGLYYPVHGDIASAVLFNKGTNSDSIIIVTFNNPMPGSYFVRSMIESQTNVSTDDGIRCPVFVPLGPTSFKWIISEVAPGTQSLKIHIEVVAIS
ncbi:hypothetical protein [Mucilaginibacter sp. L196]|uniref:hypothetical protein n=1 Tax=Mucilaginibacter sp. L196 TaxID=1641870 RepID=UPI00131EC91E|nr:hypothetical protein [Mucilaginibacter sp. L196]